MTIGIPKETCAQENRVALTPLGAQELKKAGHTIMIQEDAGINAGFPNEEYQQVGAQLVKKESLQTAHLLLRASPPCHDDALQYTYHQILFSPLHLNKNRSLLPALLQSGVTSLATEHLQIQDHHPLIDPIEEICGRGAALLGAYHLGKTTGGGKGEGILLGRIASLVPKQITILGGNPAGLAAARMACGMGGNVTLLDSNPERLRTIDTLTRKLGIHTLFYSETHLADLLPHTDLLIATTPIPNKISRKTLKTMKPHRVIVDLTLSKNQEGALETSQQTDSSSHYYYEENLIHLCPKNLAGENYPNTACHALTHASLPWIKILAKILQENPEKLPYDILKNSPLQKTLVLQRGQIL